jgi:hypothetical protein
LAKAGKESTLVANAHPNGHQQLPKGDYTFLLENSEITEEILGDMLENLKRTLETHKSNSQTVTKALSDSMLVKRR